MYKRTVGVGILEVGQNCPKCSHSPPLLLFSFCNSPGHCFPANHSLPPRPSLPDLVKFCCFLWLRSLLSKPVLISADSPNCHSLTPSPTLPNQGRLQHSSSKAFSLSSASALKRKASKHGCGEGHSLLALSTLDSSLASSVGSRESSCLQSRASNSE